MLALLTLYLIWGSTYFFIRVAIVSIPPLLMTGVRLLVAGDRITPLGVAGMVVILTGVVLVSLARERKTKGTKAIS